MIGFTHITDTFSLEAARVLQEVANSQYINPAPPGDITIITGLQVGSTLAVGTHNTDVLHSFMVEDSNTQIPAGEWYTAKTVYPKTGATVTWEVGAKLHQIVDPIINGGRDDENNLNTHCFRIGFDNVTLYNPCISQAGILGHQFGTHSCLAVYGGSHARIYGGRLEWGASNGFQGGYDDTIFDGTLFIDSTEHCVYVHGGRRTLPSDPDLRPTGISFLNCTMQDPGNGTALPDLVEGNHIQLRSFFDVTIDNCTLLGASNGGRSQYAILATGINGMTITNTTMDDFSNGLLFTASGYNYDMGGLITLNNCQATALGDYRRRIHYGDYPVTYTTCNFRVASELRYTDNDVFNTCTFQIVRDRMLNNYYANGTYNSCTFDATDAITTTFMEIEAGSSATFTGATTRIDPNGVITNWGPIPAS